MGCRAWPKPAFSIPITESNEGSLRITLPDGVNAERAQPSVVDENTFGNGSSQALGSLLSGSIVVAYAIS